MVYKGGRENSINESSRLGESLNLSIYSQPHGLETTDENAVIYFVLPHGITEATCSENMSLGYHMCIDSGIRAKWLNEDVCLRTTPAPRNVFVLSSFKGACYDHLFSFYNAGKFEIIGPQCIRISVESKDDIPIRNKGHPMFTLAMQDIVITLTGYTEKKKEKEELENLVKNMNGTVSPVYALGTTHIVAGSLLTDKIKLAYSKEKPVMTAEWIRAVWKDSQKELIKATDPKYVKYLCPIFYNLNICVSQVPSVKKQALKSIIETNGGKYFNELARTTVNVLVIPCPGGEKYRFAKEWEIPCVTPSWVENCKSAGHILPLENFAVNGESDDNKTSTPTKTAKKINLFPAVVSMIHNTSKFVVEASVCSAVNETLSSNLTTEVLNVVKRASDEGPFLDGCKIYLCGSDTMQQVRKLLNGSGATRLNRLDEHVTHVLVIGSKIPDDDANCIQKLATKPYVVNMGWLVESARQGSPADEDLHCFIIETPKANEFRKNFAAQLTPSLTIGELVEKKASSIKYRDKVPDPSKAKLPPRQLLATDKIASSDSPLSNNNAQRNALNNIEGLSEIQQEAHDCTNESYVTDNPLTPLADGGYGRPEGGYSRTEEEASGVEEDTLTKVPFSKKCSGENVRALSQHNKSAMSAGKSYVQNVSQTTTYDGEENETNFTPPFAGMTFSVQLLVAQEKNDIEEIISEMHGEIVKEGCDVVILPVVYTTEQNLIGKSCFTKYWVLDCNEARTTDIPEARYHSPLPKFKGMRSILEGVVIAVSQYLNSEKSYLATLAMEMGAEYQDVFSRKKTHTTQRTTHLICSVADNDKCTAANKWGVPIVTADWIYDCYRSKKVLQGVNYHPGNKKGDSDSTISCIPVTPKGNNVTSNKHAQRLTALSSMAFYPPSTVKPQRAPVATVASLDAFATPKALKRKSSAQTTPVSCGSISDIDIDVDSQTPGGNRRSKGNYSDLDLVPAKPIDESPLLWGLSREASRQLKRGLDAACSNSPGPDLSSLQVKFKKRAPDNVLMNSMWADIKEKYPRQKSMSQYQASTNQLPVVRVSLENKMKTNLKENGIPKMQEFDDEYERMGSKKRKTSGSSEEEAPEREIEMDIQEIPADYDHSISSHKDEETGITEIMKNTVVFISKRCENIDSLTDTIEIMGGKVTTELKTSGLTHLVYQGKNAHMSKEVKTVANSDVKVVDPIWVFKCQEKMTLLDENLYRPGRVSEPVVSTEKNKSNSKGSLDALENLVQQHDLAVEEDIEASYEDTQGKTIKYKKTENIKAKDEDSDEIECGNDDKWANDANHRPKFSNKKEPENAPKTPETEKAIEKLEEDDKRKKASTGSAKENSNSKCKSERRHVSNSNEKTDEPNAKTTRVTRSRSVAQPIENQVNDGKATTEKMKSSETDESIIGNPMFSISALNDEQKSLAIQVVQQLGGSVSKESIFDFKTDAVIAGTLARSEKVLGSLACGKKLLKLSYIHACKAANKFVSFEGHTWLLKDAKNDLEKQVVVAANYWGERIGKNPSDKPYAKYKIYLVPSKKGAGMTRLILAGGGTVVNSIVEANLVVAESKDKIPGEIPSNVPAQSVTFLSELLLLQSTLNKQPN